MLMTLRLIILYPMYKVILHKTMPSATIATSFWLFYEVQRLNSHNSIQVNTPLHYGASP